jgi:hypothetical protein
MLTTLYWTISKSLLKDKLTENSMNPMDILNLLFQYSLLHLYAPIIDKVGFSHPLTFAIITIHNTFSLTYLLFAVAVAYPVFHRKTWLIPAAVTTMWLLISITVVAALNLSTITAIAALLPHGWLEFTAIVYWTKAIRKATQISNLPEQTTTPTFKDYIKALMKPKKFMALAKKDAVVSFKITKLSFKTLSKRLRKAYVTMLILITIAALIETFITPNIMFLINNL